MEMPTKTFRDAKASPEAKSFRDAKASPEAKSFRDERRERIIQVARSVFYEVGYAGASMSMISARLGGSKATLYAYFNSKEELFEAIIREHCGEMLAVMEAHMDSTDFRQTLTALGRQLLGTIMSTTSIRTIQLVIEESHRNPNLAQLFHNVMESQGRAGMKMLLQRAHDNGLIHAPDIEETAGVLKSLMFGNCHMKRLFNVAPEPTVAELHRQVDLAVDVFMTYYGREKTAG